MKPLGMDYELIRESHGDEVAKAVESLQSLFTDGLVSWFAGLWDDKIGAFYYSNSARDNEGFLPDIESSMQAFGSLLTAGLFPSYSDFPADMAGKVCAFAQNLQDPDDGFFYHPQWGKNINTSRRGRDHANALGLIREVGGKEPLYVDANTRIKEAAAGDKKNDDIIPEHLRSREAFLEYLEGLNINAASYAPGHHIGAQAAQIRAAGLVDVCIEFLNSHQYENGLWEKELSYRASNGLMKISCAYRGMNRPFPRLEEALDASIKIALLDTRPSAITDVYNTFYTIENVFKNFEDSGDAELLEKGRARLRESAAELLRVTKKKLEIFKKPDGSFSYCPDMSSITSQAALASLGSCEGDVNATVIALSTRRRCLTQLGIEPSATVFSKENADEFTKIILQNASRKSAPKHRALYPNIEAISEEHGEEIGRTVKYLNSLYSDGLVKWIANLWDPVSGGFYYANSSRDNEGFFADVESTAQAMGHIKTLGIVKDYSELPLEMREKMISFLQGLQDPDDGYFYHPQWGKDINTSRRGRDLNNAIAVLSWLGAKPLYPTALDRLRESLNNKDADNTTIPEHLRSEAAFRKYLEELNLPADSYSKGHIIGAQGAEIKAAGLADVCAEYLNSTQLENGMWEKDYTYHAASGLLKISGAYLGIGKEFPNLDKALLAAIKIAMSGETAHCLVQIYNPICTVQNLFDNVARTGKHELLAEAKEILKKNARSLLKVTKEKLGIFRKEDGSFSYNYNRSTPRSQMVEVSLGLDEGDMNAMALADSSRVRCMAILGIDGAAICDEKARREFFDIIESKIKISK